MDLSDPRVRWLAAAVFVLVLTGAAVLAGGALLEPAQDTREDIAAMQRDVDEQLGVVRTQLAALETQLDLTRSLLATTQRQVELTTETLPRIEEQGRLVAETVALQHELLELTRAMLREMREMNDKLPPPTGGGLVPGR